MSICRNALTIFAVAAVTLALGPSADAQQLTSVNFEAFTGNDGPWTFETESALEGPLGGLNTQWNQFDAVSSPGTLIDSMGNGTTISFTTNFNESRRGENSNVLPIFNSTLTYFPRTFQTRNLTIDGLEAGERYDVSLVAYRDQNPFNNGQERLSGTWSTTNATTSASSQLLDSATADPNLFDLAFEEGVNFITFENVVADGAGMVVFDAESSFRLGADPGDNDANDYHRLGLSGFQIQQVAAVPEPASVAIWSLLGLGLAGFSYYRVRRKK